MAEGLPWTLAYWPHAQTVEKKPIATCPCCFLKQKQLAITVWFLTSLAFFLRKETSFFSYQTVRSLCCLLTGDNQRDSNSPIWSLGSNSEGSPHSTTHSLLSSLHTSEPSSCCDLETCWRSHFIILDSEFLVFTSARCSSQSLLGESPNTDSHSDSG